jgi:transcriptional regulator with XRE-family HTH domain
MDVRRLVGRNLRRLRLERGLSQEALAHDAEVAPSFISQIESGKRSPTVTLLDDLARALRMPIVEFFSETKPMPAKGLPRGRRSRK